MSLFGQLSTIQLRRVHCGSRNRWLQSFISEKYFISCILYLPPCSKWHGQVSLYHSTLLRHKRIPKNHEVTLGYVILLQNSGRYWWHGKIHGVPIEWVCGSSVQEFQVGYRVLPSVLCGILYDPYLLQFFRYCEGIPEFFRCGQLSPWAPWGTLYVLNCLCGSTQGLVLLVYSRVFPLWTVDS